MSFLSLDEPLRRARPLALRLGCCALAVFKLSA